MANFKTHLNVAFAVSGTLALAAYKIDLLNHQSFLLCVALGTIGGLLPDLDSDNSRPLKIGFDVLSLVVAFFVVICWKDELTLLLLLLAWLLSYVFMRYFVFSMFTKITVHRGIIHSVPYMAVLALALVSVSFYVFHRSAVDSWLYGIFLLLGSLVHLILDEIYSVNLSGLKIKKSFGTALKFYQSSQSQYYVLLYALLAALWFIAPNFIPAYTQIKSLILMKIG